MTRGRYIDSVRGQSFSPSPSAFLKDYAEEKVEKEKPQSSGLSGAIRKAKTDQEAMEDKLVTDYENDPRKPGGFIQMAYHAAKQSQRGRT